MSREAVLSQMLAYGLYHREEGERELSAHGARADVDLFHSRGPKTQIDFHGMTLETLQTKSLCVKPEPH